MKRIGIALTVMLLAAPARGDDLLAGLSEDFISITSSFTGTDITLFGAIDARDPVIAERDIVVVLRGPDADITVRRKEPVIGIWLNSKSAEFLQLPSYYFVASTRPLSDITLPAVLARYQIGLANLRFDVSGGVAPALNPFRLAVIRANQRENLYREEIGAIGLVSGVLFQVRIPMPAEVPTGSYRAEAYLFRDGNVVSAYSAPLYIDKSGIERWLYDMAQQLPWVYGLAAVLLSIAVGWIASFIFRRPA